MRDINIITYTIIFLLLLSSCSKEDDSNNTVKKYNLNKEFIIQSEGDFLKFGIITENYSSFYPTQLFNKHLIKDGILSEIQTEMYSHSLIFDFYPRPYIEEVLEPKGFLSFTKVLINAMKSEEWKIYSESGITKSQLVSCAIYSSKDDAKRFLEDTSLYTLVNEYETEYFFLAKIISSKFNILTSIDNKFIDKKLDDACYVSSVSFGRYAYLAIPTNKNPEKIMDLFVNGILKGNMAYVDEYLKISSSINLIEKGGSNNNGYWGESGFRKLIEIFNINSRYSGVPIYFELRDAITNEIVKS